MGTVNGGHIDCGGLDIKPGSLHYAARRTNTVRKKKPGRFGREDRESIAAAPKGDFAANEKAAQVDSARLLRSGPMW
jgi:hypothetical protein